MSADKDTSAHRLSVAVGRVVQPTPDTRILDLWPAPGTALPDFEAGAHIAVHCGDFPRHYSLFGPRQAPSFYRIAVKLETQGRGGSRWLFEHAAVGASLSISPPRNNFPLALGRPKYVFIAGGIGVTPVFSMLDALHEAGIRARLLYLCRSPDDFAFAEQIGAERARHDVVVHFDSSAGGFYDIAAELRAHDDSTEVYCCGPAPLMQTVRRFAEESDHLAQFHFEFFGADPVDGGLGSAQAEFEIVAQKSGATIPVRADQSMLAALREAGIVLESECEEGVCGTCAVGVLAGEPDHRDFVLTQAERESGAQILTCVSRSKTPRIVLDI